MNTIIPIYPPKVINDPQVRKLMAEGGVTQSPVSIEHTLIDCTCCGQQGWIGPRQLQAANAGKGVVLCVICMVTHLPDTDFEYQGLNPGADDLPRRSW